MSWFAKLAPAAVLLGLLSSPVLAQTQATSLAATQLVMSDAVKATRGHLTLSATLSSVEGKPLNGKAVAFYEHVNLFGERDALIASGITDSTGYVAIDYQPVENGLQLIKAHFAGDAQFVATDASTSIEVRDAIPVYTADVLPLATVREWLPLGLASIVLATWAVLIGVTLRTVRGIRALEGRKS
jgi:hypothetical protein